MNYLDDFLTNLLRLPKTFNHLAAGRMPDYYKISFSGSMHTPYGTGHLDTTPIEGYHFKLNIIYEPINPEAEVLNDWVSLVVCEDSIKNVKFSWKNEIIEEKDIKLSSKNCKILFLRVRDFCGAALE